MLSFSAQINQAIKDYKIILKRQLDSTSKRKKIRELGINRMALRQNGDILLYKKATEILKELKNYIDQHEDSAAWYSGIDRFYVHLQDLLNNYHIQDDKVIHNKQTVSHALLEIIQIAKIPKDIRSANNKESLDKAVNTIEKYGTQRDKTQAIKLLEDFVEK